MLPRIIYTFALLFAHSLFSSTTNIYCSNPEGDDLNLADRGNRIENCISLSISESDFVKIKGTDGTEISLGNALVIINGDTLESEKISTRGGTSLLFRRKSFSFSLKSGVAFRHGERKESLKKFYALSLSMDKDYFCNRLAFEMMERIRLFGLFYSFSEFRINGKTEGICMVVERPEDWAIKELKSPLIIRRGYDQKIDKMKISKVVEKSDAEKYKKHYSMIYKSLNNYEGEELYAKLSQWIDLENYMKWLSFNYIVHNGDYTDEVFLYIDPAVNKYKVIPWDYDDLFATSPHEGRTESRKLLGNKFLFSSEDRLDIKIAEDPFLYKIYLSQLLETLNQLPSDTVKKVFENTYAELYPYFSDNDIICMSKYDSHSETNLPKLDSDMRSLFVQLISLNTFLKEYLKNQNSN